MYPSQIKKVPYKNYIYDIVVRSEKILYIIYFSVALERF